MKPSILRSILPAGAIVATMLLSRGGLEANSAPAPGDSLERCGAPPGAPAARAKARRLVRQIRSDLASVENQIRNAPFIATIETGQA